ncbi:amidohydrolase family protein [Saccharopolyspora hirsuta]|uniref:amidohydrolase family protein n=1 Tax=Saccharopolyspora hirsuta TaxID=1837 RepID=UPI00333346B6
MERVLRDVWVISGRAGDEPFVGDIAVANGRITHIDRSTRRPVRPTRAVLPGLANAHLHPTPALLRTALASITIDDNDRSPLVGRLYEALRADREALQLGARLALAETMSSGATCGCLHEYLAPEVAARQAAELGFPCVVAVHPGEPGWREVLARVRDTGAEVMLAGLNENDPANTDEALRELAAWAGELGVRVHAHVSETRERHEHMRARTGRTPVAHYREMGLLEHLYAVHCTAVEDEDVELLAAHDVPVVVTPSSEALLGDGIAPLAALREAGVRVGLGTDGAAWAGGEDVLRELTAAALLSRAVGGPGALRGGEVIELATLGGARVLGCESERGSVEVGKRADLVVLDLERPGLRPVLEGPLSTVREVIAFAATGADVIETMIGGTAVHRRGGTPLVEVDAVQDAAERVWRRAGGDRARTWL